MGTNSPGVKLWAFDWLLLPASTIVGSISLSSQTYISHSLEVGSRLYGLTPTSSE